MRGMKWVGAFLLSTMIVLCSASTSCSTTSLGKKIEAMTPAQLDVVQGRVGVVMRVLAGVLVRKGKLKAGDAEKIADVVDAIAKDELSVVVHGLVSKKLIEQGWTDDEVLAAVYTVEDLVRAFGGLGEQGLPLGPNARLLLTGIATALRQSIGGVIEAERVEAEKILKEEGVEP